MPFYHRKTVILLLVIISSLLTWLSYLWAVENYRPSLEKTQALTKIADEVRDFMQQNNLRGIGINNGEVWPESLRDKTFTDRISSEIAIVSSNIERVSFSYRCQPECYFTAYFYFDIQQEFSSGPYRYIQYNPDGHLEHLPGYPAKSQLTEYRQYNWLGWTEEFVPSISEALKEDVGYVYFFCEPLEQEHWHFCRGEYD